MRTLLTKAKTIVKKTQTFLPAQGHVPLMLRPFIVCQTFIGSACSGLANYLNKNCKKVPNLSSGGTFSSWMVYSTRLNREIIVGDFTLSTDIDIFLVDGIPVIIESNNGSQNVTTAWLYFPRHFFSDEFFPQKSLNFNKSEVQNNSKFKIIYKGSIDKERGEEGFKDSNSYGVGVPQIASRPGWNKVGTLFEEGTSPSDLSDPDPYEKVEDLILSQDALKVVDFVRLWYKAKDDYAKRRLQWSCSFIFEGLPGTGKTALARALAFEMQIPIYVLRMGSLTAHSFENAWQDILQNSPCVVLLDDFDRVYDKSKPIGKNSPPFDLVLQALSGVSGITGLVTIIAVNDINKVDSAIYTKEEKGDTQKFGRRASICATFDLPSVEQRYMLAKRILFDFTEEQLQRIVRESSGDSGKQIVDRCAFEMLKYTQQQAGLSE